MTEILYGRHTILEMLKANRRRISEVKVAEETKKSEVLTEILRLATSRKIPIVEKPRSELDRVRDHHQGILAYCSAYPYVEVDQILKNIATKSTPTTILMLDVIQDPQNLGTLLRTSEAVGVDGIIIPRRRAVGVTPAVARASAGASEHLQIAQHNLSQALKRLRTEGVWIYGLERSLEALRIDEVELHSSLAIVVGAEGGGLRRLTRDGCDQLISLPMQGNIASLNASVAGSIALYFVWHSRGFS